MTETFNALFAPASVAVIGASDNPNKVGGRPIHYLRQFGYQGEVFPVNPGRDTIQGYRAYPTLDAIGKTPDAVVIAVSGDATLEQVRVCAEAGVKAAVIMASGFAETGEAGGSASNNWWTWRMRAACGWWARMRRARPISRAAPC